MTSAGVGAAACVKEARSSRTRKPTRRGNGALRCQKQARTERSTHNTQAMQWRELPEFVPWPAKKDVKKHSSMYKKIPDHLYSQKEVKGTKCQT